jgi:hypothetical protein
MNSTCSSLHPQNYTNEPYTGRKNQAHYFMPCCFKVNIAGTEFSVVQPSLPHSVPYKQVKTQWTTAAMFPNQHVITCWILMQLNISHRFLPPQQNLILLCKMQACDVVSLENVSYLNIFHILNNMLFPPLSSFLTVPKCY